MEFDYRKEKPDPKVRKADCQKLIEKYPDKIPILFQRDPKCKAKKMIKTKYLVLKKTTVNHFLLLLRTKLELKSSESFFLLVDGKYSITGNETLEEIYNKYKDKEDGFLYLVYSTEEVWG